MSRQIRRRRFLGVTAATLAGGYFSQGTTATSARGAEKSPNERLNLATVGTANRAGANIRGVEGENLVALCDIDSKLLDAAAEAHPKARRYRDFREMLDKEAERIDGVLVSTPDHCHAPAAALALRLKKHVYCEKPLTHTVFEARTLARLARENKLVTQMGTQIHAGDNYRRVVELVQSGAIGDVTDVHVWVPATYSGAAFKKAQKPDHVDWDLWLGPAEERPYSPDIHPFHWRKFWDYGTGGLGDFGCHYMDLVHWALDLRAPQTVSAEGSPVDAVSCPEWTIARYQYPARGSRPPVKLTWYDGAKRPPQLEKLTGADGKPLDWRSGQLFIGSQGMILSDYGRHVLLPAEKFADFQRPPQTIAASIGHHLEWLQAIRTGGPTTCNFDYSGALTEAVLLGTVAYRSGETLQWDADQLKVVNSEAAQHLIHKEYRSGWEL